MVDAVTSVADSLLLAATRVSTFVGTQLLTHASGFFFERDARLFLVTSRHVLSDPASGHAPDRIELELHTDRDNLTQSTGLSILLYHQGRAVWHQGRDTAGAIDVAVLELDRSALPADVAMCPFGLQHLLAPDATVEIGASLLVVGFPLGFHDTLHHLPVVRQAVLASAYGLRFQGEGYFLTDARTHRGTSGAPVVMRTPSTDAATEQLPWLLLGVHSARLDMGGRELGIDEALGLNCAWYADILLTLTTDGSV
jgi:S1-C subfamily serine protease